jgi:hypothetical protein
MQKYCDDYFYRLNRLLFKDSIFDIFSKDWLLISIAVGNK